MTHRCRFTLDSTSSRAAACPARLGLAVGLLALLLLALVARRPADAPSRPRARRRRSQKPELRRHPDRRPDARPALRDLHAVRRGADPGDAEHARPDRQPRHHLQPLLRLLPALLPLAGQPADRPLRPQPQRPRQRPARTAATPASRSAAPTPTTSPPGCRAPATGRSTSASSSTATATNRSTTATTVPPGWSAWHTVLNADTDHYYYGYTLNDNGVDRRALRRLRQLGNPRIRRPRRLRLPLRAAQRPALLYETDVFTRIASEEMHGDAARTALLPAARLHRPARRLPPPGRARAGAAPLRLLRRRAPTRTAARKASTRATSTTSRASSAKRPTSRSNDIHTYRVYYQKALESLRSVDDGVKQIVDTLGGLHRLRNTYIIFTSDNGFFFGEHRLTGGKFLAYEPSTHLPFLIRGPGIKPGTSTGELAANIDIAPTILELAGADAGQEHRRPLAGALHARPQPAHAGGRSSSSPSSKPTTSKRTAAPTADRAGPRRQPGSAGGGRASTRRGASASIVAPPKDYEGIRLGPYKYIEWPDGEKELYDIDKDPYELNNMVRDPQLLPDPRLPPPRSCEPARGLRRPHLPGSGAEIPADPRPAAQASAAGTQKTEQRKNGNSGNRNAKEQAARTASR